MTDDFGFLLILIVANWLSFVLVAYRSYQQRQWFEKEIKNILPILKQNRYDIWRLKQVEKKKKKD